MGRSSASSISLASGACSVSHAWLLRKIGLEPFSLTMRDAHNLLIEYNRMSHRRNVQALSGGSFQCRAIVPAKLMADNNEDHILTDTTLATMIHRSPYKIMLMRNKYHELDSSVTTLLNQDWDIHPEAKYVCAQLLAGAMLLNSNGETILISTIEIYGRTKAIDIHREMNSGESSIPPDNAPYLDIYPTKLRTNEDSKLVIGMQICNGLVASRLRLDVVKSPKVDPVPSAFDVDCRRSVF